MEDLTPVHEFDETVEFYNFVFKDINIEEERQKIPNFPLIEADVASSLDLINLYIEQHPYTKAKVLHADLGSNFSPPFLTGCDPSEQFFMIWPPDFYEWRFQ